MASATVRNGAGYVTFYFDPGAHEAAQVGATKNIGSATLGGSTQAVSLVFRKNFAWFPSSALASGWSFTYAGRPRTFFIVGAPEQSNGEGRGKKAQASAIVNATKVAPNDYPYDENMGGASPATDCVGPLLKLADTLLSNPVFAAKYARVCIMSMATGGSTLAEQWGTNGTDGLYNAQMVSREVCGGPEGSLQPCLMQPGDDYAIVTVIGETDVNDGTVATFADDMTEITDFIREVSFPSSNCKAIVHARLPPTAPTGANQTHQNTCRAQQASLAKANATPPVFVEDVLDSDRNAAPDDVHSSAAGAERLGTAMANTIVAAVSA